MTKSSMHPVGNDNRSPGSRLPLVGTALIIVLLAVAAAGIWDRRKDAIRQARQEIADFAIILAERTDHSIARADRVLREVRGETVAAGIGTTEQLDRLAKPSTVRHVTPGGAENRQRYGAIWLIAADGRVQGVYGAPPSSDRDYVAYLRLHDDPDPYVGIVATSKAGVLPALIVARRIDAGDRTLLGIAVAAVPLDYYERFYTMILRRKGGAAEILREDGKPLVRWPAVEVPSAEPAQGSGSAASTGSGDARLVASHPIGRWHIAVAVSAPEAVVLADWRRHSAFIAAGAIVVACILVLLFRTLAKRSRSLERSQGELRESEARFRDFALTSSDWFWETDAQHRFVYQSEGIRSFGQEPRNRLGRLRVDLAADAATEPEKWREHLAVLDRHDPFRDFVYERQVGGDPGHIITVSGNPVFDPVGRFLGYRGTARNITEQVLAERSLRAAKAAAESANLAKSQFLANMSHELRTPLNAILGFAELLESGAAGPLAPRGREYAGLVRQSGAHLLEVINELLDLARIDAGKLELHEERGIDPRRLVEHCVQLVEPQADAAQLRISVDIADPLPRLVGDRGRLAEILRSLLSNAIKFTEPGGSASISARQATGGEMVFEVRDSGIGLTEAEIRIALEPFGQVDRGLSRRFAGAGLGLPLARRLAELHGGSLRILSEKGVGTTATLLLPASRIVCDPVLSTDC